MDNFEVMKQKIDELAESGSGDVFQNIEDRIYWVDRRTVAMEKYIYTLRGTRQLRPIWKRYMANVRELNHLRQLFDTAKLFYCKYCGHSLADPLHTVEWVSGGWYEPGEEVCFYNGINTDDVPF